MRAHRIELGAIMWTYLGRLHVGALVVDDLAGATPELWAQLWPEVEW